MARRCLGHIAHCLARRRASTVAAASAGHRITGEDLVDSVRGLTAGLVGRGVRPGGIVAVVAFNSVEYIELFLAITYVGAIIAPLDYRWSFEEAAQALELVQSSVFIFDDSYSSWVLRLTESKIFPSISLYLILGDTCSSNHAPNFLSVDHIRRSVRGTTAIEPVSAPSGVALICFTSGTTGGPKGVAISHTSLIIQSLAKIAIVGYGLPPHSPSAILEGYPHAWLS